MKPGWCGPVASGPHLPPSSQGEVAQLTQPTLLNTSLASRRVLSTIIPTSNIPLTLISHAGGFAPRYASLPATIWRGVFLNVKLLTDWVASFRSSTVTGGVAGLVMTSSSCFYSSSDCLIYLFRFLVEVESH